ncbi:unnamed protein product, partial [marine sediment metagenome]
ELVTPDNIDAVKDNLGDFGYVDEILAYDIEGDCRFLGVI